MMILAHRGASADRPENTLTAFREAAAQGADGVELDAMVCGSGEVVVCHDERLGRLAGLDWEVAKTSFRKLAQVDVGSRLGFSPERVPLLEEVVAALPGQLLINVELKCESVDDRGLSEKVGRYLSSAALGGRVVVSSFNAGCLFRLAAAFPELRRGYLIDPKRSYALHGGVIAPLVSSHSVHLPWELCSRARVEGWHRRGLKVAAWTVDEPEAIRELEAIGVDYLITNRPRAAREALGLATAR